MKSLARLVVVVALGAACAACSQSQPQSQSPSAPATSAPGSASAIPMAPPPAASVDAAPAPRREAPTLQQLMQRPGFARTFDAMDGAASLPAWVKTTGGSEPVSSVLVGNKHMWLAHACETRDCQGSQLYLLIDPASHTMQGVFVRSNGTAGAQVRQLVWLGDPEGEARSLLQSKVSPQ